MGTPRAPTLVGQRFGLLVVTDDLGTRPNGDRFYAAVCDCGNTTAARRGNLLQGQCRSCGCQQGAPRVIIALGQRFGRLTVMAEARADARRSRLYVVRCDCGTTKIVRGTHIASGSTVSCGCFRNEGQRARKTNLSHGHAARGRRSPTYRTWYSMVQRCTNPKTVGYKNYGGRGITVCERWRQFENFLADMGERPDDRSVDRIDNDGNYEPSNCRWATRSEQMRNRRKRTVT